MASGGFCNFACGNALGTYVGFLLSSVENYVYFLQIRPKFPFCFVMGVADIRTRAHRFTTDYTFLRQLFPPIKFWLV